MTEETSNLSWDDDLGDIDEKVSEEDVKAAENMGKVPVGKYFCKCIDSQPRQKDFKEYSCIAVNLRWEIMKVLELDGKAVVGDEGEGYEGRAIYDDIALYAGAEKDGMRKRRILVAKRTGLISGSADKITKQMWQKDIIGKTALITYIEESYYPKGSTVERKIRKVDFSGYDDASGMNVTDNAPDIDDI